MTVKRHYAFNQFVKKNLMKLIAFSMKRVNHSKTLILPLCRASLNFYRCQTLPACVLIWIYDWQKYSLFLLFYWVGRKKWNNNFSYNSGCLVVIMQLLFHPPDVLWLWHRRKKFIIVVYLKMASLLFSNINKSWITAAKQPVWFNFLYGSGAVLVYRGMPFPSSCTRWF